MFLKSIIFSSLLILAQAESQVQETFQCSYVIDAYEKMGGSVTGLNRNSPIGCCEMEGVNCAQGSGVVTHM